MNEIVKWGNQSPVKKAVVWTAGSFVAILVGNFVFTVISMLIPSSFGGALLLSLIIGALVYIDA